MHSVRRRCSTQISLVTNNSPWTRSYCNEWKEGHVRVSEKKKFLKVYENVKVAPPSHERHPKIPVPIKPFQAKKTPETDPWLFLIGVFPKSVQEYNKEAEEKRLNPPGMEFQGVWLDNSVIENAKRDRFAKELITFRDSYEKPVVDAFKEVDAELEANYTKARFEERKKTRKHQKSLKKKAKPGSTLLRYMEEKDYWEKFVSAMHIGNFSELPLRKETDDLMTFEALKFDIEEPSYDYNLIKHDYGQRSDWTVAQHMALMVPDDEIEQLKIDNLLTPENLDQIYRYVKELEHVYGPLGEKISNITRTHIQAVDNSNAEYLRSKNKEIPPKVWEVFNPEHIKEFDDIQDPDKVSLEEIDHRLEQAFQNWKKRLLDPEVERRVKHYVRHLMGGDVWPRFTVGGNNRLVQFADSPIANKRIFLNDADQVRILKGQLVDAGLAKVIVRRRGEAPTEPGSGSATESASEADSTSVQAKQQPEVVETPEGPITRPIPLEREKSPILTDDANAYLEFLPTYKDRGTFLLPPKQKVVREETRESLEESFQKEIMTMDDRNQGGNPTRLARSKREKYLPVFRSVKDYERLTPDELKLLKDNEEENILAHRQFQKWRTLWPHPTTGEGDMDGEALKNFMKSDRWFPVNHLFYKHNVEFFVRTLPLAPELKRADLMRMRKVVMRVYVAPLELPPVVDRRLKQLLGPRYNQPGKTVTLTGSDRHTQKDNKAYLKLLFREILHEAWLADPNYLPTREPAVEPPRTWTPSQAANQTAKPIIFRLYGTPLQNQDAQKTQVDQINSVIGGGVKAPESTRDQDYEKRMEELKNYDTGAIINTISYGPPKVKRSQQQKQQQEQPPTEQEQEQGQQEQPEQKEQQVQQVASGEKPTLKKRKELGLPIAPKKAKPMNQAFIYDKDIVYEVEEEAPAPTPTPAPAAPAQKDKKKK